MGPGGPPPGMMGGPGMGPGGPGSMGPPPPPGGMGHGGYGGHSAPGMGPSHGGPMGGHQAMSGQGPGHGGGSLQLPGGGSLDLGGAEAEGFMGDVKSGLRLTLGNLVGSVMVMGVPVIGSAFISGLVTFLVMVTGLGILSLLSYVGLIFSLLSLIAYPALFYFMMQAHLGTPVSWMSAYRAVLGRGIGDLVSFWVASIIGFIALVLPLGYFVGPTWILEERKFVDLNMRSLELWKPMIVRSFLVLICAGIITVPFSIVASILTSVGVGLGGGLVGGILILAAILAGAVGNAVVAPIYAGAVISGFFAAYRQAEGVDGKAVARAKLDAMASGAPEIPGADRLGGLPGMGQPALNQGYPGGSPSMAPQPMGQPQYAQPGQSPYGPSGPSAPGYPPQGQPQGYPPQGQQGYPPQGGGQGGYPPPGYPPPGYGGPPPGYPGGPPGPGGQQGYPQQPGYPPGQPPGGYPGYPPHR